MTTTRGQKRLREYLITEERDLDNDIQTIDDEASGKNK